MEVGVFCFYFGGFVVLLCWEVLVFERGGGVGGKWEKDFEVVWVDF